MVVYDIQAIRQDFPILGRKINGKPLCYLDSAATTQKPRVVLDAMQEFYTHYNANVHRGVYTIAEEATVAFEAAHETVGKFVNADSGEMIFTGGTTHSINLLAYTLPLGKGEEIALTQLEHHSNLVPWQQLAKRTGAKLKFIPIKKDGSIDISAAEKLITEKTKIVAVTHISNMLGTIVPVKEVTKLAHAKGSLVVVDAAQSVGHMPLDVQSLGADFVAFSGHKMYAPTGIGVLWGKKEKLEALPPFFTGGDMIREVQWEQSSWNDVPWKFEAGTPNVAGAIGLAAAVKYLQKTGMDKIGKHEHELIGFAMERLRDITQVTIYGPQERGSIISFNVGNIHAHDVASILDRDGVCIRGGHHCTMPLHNHLGIAGSARMSVSCHTTQDEIGRLIEGINAAKKIFRMA